MQLRRFVVRPDLEDFLVERRRPWIEPLVHEVIRDARVLSDGLVGLPCPGVEVPEGVCGVPVARLILHHARVLDNRRIQPALPEQLLRLFQRVFAVEGQGGFSAGERYRGRAYDSILSNKVGGRNERRCTGEYPNRATASR